VRIVDLNVLLYAVNSDAVLVSCDTDFGRFKSLRWENPLG
jgi:predicted nuclease of predicted toxin-antitoxin system